MAPNLGGRLLVIVMLNLLAIMVLTEIFQSSPQDDYFKAFEKKHPGFYVFIATGLVLYVDVIIALAMLKPT